MNALVLTLIAAACVASGGGGVAASLVAPVTNQPPPIVLEQSEVRGSVDDGFERRLEAMDARVGAVRTLRARFTQKKHTPLLKNPMVSTGIVRVRGDVTRWDTVEPSGSVMTIDGAGLSIYFPEQRIIEVYALEDDIREFSGSPLPRLAALRGSFDLAPVAASALGAEDTDESLIAMELLPRTDAMKEHVAFIRVLIDERLPAVRRIEIEDVDGERTEISFHDIEVDASIGDGEMTLEVPAGVRRVHPLSPASDRVEDSDK